ncbi:MAG: hypothetical protein M1833_004875 [Piccolia ochrophora]|nr:MAG: hypothetical protein M1833_004875 [Piccolia ochrophora]
MEEQVQRLVDKTWAKFQDLTPSRRLLISISGIPGSGKTTLAANVSNRLNALHHASSPACNATTSIAAFIPMDGYHLSRAQLSALPDPTTAHARRGAAFTFDGDSFLHLVHRLREPLTPETLTLYAPSFDHAVKDPVADDIAIGAGIRIVLFEGNYLTLDRAPWNEAARLMDALWFVDVDMDVARRRLVRRHVEAGIAADEHAARSRVEENDLVNGEEILAAKVAGIEEVVVSREDEAWMPEAQEKGTAGGL